MKTCPQCDTGYPDSHTTCPTHGVPLNEIRDLKPGMVIHQSYRILRKLGQGGMGAVYLAQHTLMNEPQALKFLSSELSQDQAFTARFLREVRTLRQIRHKNVVDAGNLESAEDGTLFFSMEFVDGPDLRAFLLNSSRYLHTDCHPERSLARDRGPQRQVFVDGVADRGPQRQVFVDGVADRGPQRQVFAAGAAGRQTESKDLRLYSADEFDALKGHDFNRAVREPNETAALAAGGGVLTEGDGGFNPRITPTKSTLALAPEGSLPVELALSITRQIAEGLGAAHAKGMVHRDIKPENILMARDGGAWLPKIADFGIVATKESSAAFTKTGGTLLTMAYAAPELWRGIAAAELDGRTDLYALGGLLYEMLTGQTVFHAENYEGWARQHQTTPPPPPSTLRPDLARWQGLDALALCLLAKDRNDRPKDVAELLGLIDAVRSGVLAPRLATVVEPPLISAPMPNTIPLRSVILKWGMAALLFVICLGIWAAVRFTHSTASIARAEIQTAAQPASVSTPTATKPFPSASAVPAPVPGGGMNHAAQPGTIPFATSNAATLLVLCDLACNWKLDGKALGRLAAGDSIIVPLSLGWHRVDATTLDGLDGVKKEIEISTGEQMNVHLALQSVQAARFKVDQGIRDKAAQEARDKAAQEVRDQSAREQQERDRQERERVAREAAAGVWTDPATGLMWTKKDNVSDVNWQEAMDYCGNLQLSGHSGWRLPTIEELQRIHDAHANVGGYHVKGDMQLSSLWHWSSSKGNASWEAWDFHFSDGERVSNRRDYSHDGHALCVRRSGE